MQNYFLLLKIKNSIIQLSDKQLAAAIAILQNYKVYLYNRIFPENLQLFPFKIV